MKFPVLLVVSRAGRTAGIACDLHSVFLSAGPWKQKTHTKLKTNKRKYVIYTAGSFPFCMQNILDFSLVSNIKQASSYNLCFLFTVCICG